MIHFKKNSPKYLKRVRSDVNIPFTSLLIATHDLQTNTFIFLFAFSVTLLKESSSKNNSEKAKGEIY